MQYPPHKWVMGRESIKIFTKVNLSHLRLSRLMAFFVSSLGDQAEIVFTLIGEPPFTFTYQRSEPVSKKGGKLGKVLETHTVSRIYAREYSIYSALEGTWTVTSISDKYCRYPPAETSGEKPVR
jgi:hypothetical protein